MGKDLNGNELGKGYVQRKDGQYEARKTIKGNRIDIIGRDLDKLKVDFTNVINKIKFGVDNGCTSSKADCFDFSNNHFYVYFIKNESDKVKIGKTIDVNKRYKQLQTGSPEKLYVVYSIPCRSKEHMDKVESSLHEYFKDYNISGEWFLYKPVEKYLHTLKTIMEDWRIKNE